MVEAGHRHTNGMAVNNLTILVVEDDSTSREMLQFILSTQYQTVISAIDGTDGLDKYMQFRPDIVVSDQLMPGLTGLQLFDTIRKHDDEVQLVLVTGSLDYEMLAAALNCQVNHFIPKPFNQEALLSIMHSLSKELINRREVRQCQLQEMELFRYREQYNTMQQEAAVRKERHVSNNDVKNQVLYGCDSSRWSIETAFTPRDVMCGDAFSVRTLKDGRLLIFLVDAMGAGLSASLSALFATSFCNYLVSHLPRCPASFTLGGFIDNFIEYIRGILLHDEVVSCGFFLVDLQSLTMENAMFGLPPLMVRKLEGTALRIPGGNPPMGTFSMLASINTFSLDDISDILIMTDGITDTELPSGDSYRGQIFDDFQAAPTLAYFQNIFQSKTAGCDLDDRTLLHLLRLDQVAAWSWSTVVFARDNQHDICSRLLRGIKGHVPVSTSEQDAIILVVGRVIQKWQAISCLTNPEIGEPQLSINACIRGIAVNSLLSVEFIGSSGVGDEFWGNDSELLQCCTENADAAVADSSGARLYILKTLEGAY